MVNKIIEKLETKENDTVAEKLSEHFLKNGLEFVGSEGEWEPHAHAGIMNDNIHYHYIYLRSPSEVQVVPFKRTTEGKKEYLKPVSVPIKEGTKISLFLYESDKTKPVEYKGAFDSFEALRKIGY